MGEAHQAARSRALPNTSVRLWTLVGGIHAAPDQIHVCGVCTAANLTVASSLLQEEWR